MIVATNWHKGTELPDKSCNVLVVNENNVMLTVNYSHKYKVFNCYDSCKDTKHSFAVKWWAYANELLNALEREEK